MVPTSEFPEFPLVLSEKHQQAFIQDAREVFFQIDSVGVCTFLNPAWTRITGFSVEKTLQTSFFNYIYPNDRQTIRDLFRRMITGQQDRCCQELRCLTQDHTFCWVESEMRLVTTPEGEVLGIWGTLIDIAIVSRRNSSSVCCKP